MSKNKTAKRDKNVQLPPLILDGDAKIFEKMTIKELDSCLKNAIKACLDGAGPKFRSAENLPWWPVDKIPSRKELNTRAKTKQDKIMIYRHLLIACYTYYQQQDVLHLFDSEPNSPPRWDLLEKSDGYYLVALPSFRTIAVYSNQELHKILPLIAMSARQSELRKNKKKHQEISYNKKLGAARSRLLMTNVDNCFLSSHYPSLSKQLALSTCDLAPRTLSSPSPLYRDRPETSDGEFSEGTSRRNSTVSIMGSWSPRRSSTVADSPIKGSEHSPPAPMLECSLCRVFKCYKETNLAVHMTFCRCSTRSSVNKALFLSHLGLMPKEVEPYYKKSLEPLKKRQKLVEKLSFNDVKFLAQYFSLTALYYNNLQNLTNFEAGINSTEEFGNLPSAGFGSNKLSFFNPDIYQTKFKSQEELDEERFKIFFPAVYKGDDLLDDYKCHVPIFTKSGWRKRAELLRYHGLGPESRNLLKHCKKCHVILERLPDSILNVGTKNLNVLSLGDSLKSCDRIDLAQNVQKNQISDEGDVEKLAEYSPNGYQNAKNVPKFVGSTKLTYENKPKFGPSARKIDDLDLDNRSKKLVDILLSKYLGKGIRTAGLDEEETSEDNENRIFYEKFMEKISSSRKIGPNFDKESQNFDEETSKNDMNGNKNAADDGNANKNRRKRKISGQKSGDFTKIKRKRVNSINFRSRKLSILSSSDSKARKHLVSV